jgi:hypothetical protein
MQKRLLRIAVATAVTFVVQAFSIPALHATEQLRAAKCCAEQCDRPAALAGHRCDCCFSADADAAAAAIAGKPASPSPSAAIAAQTAVDVCPPLAAVLERPVTAARAAPVFLLTLSLRL